MQLVKQPLLLRNSSQFVGKTIILPSDTLLQWRKQTNEWTNKMFGLSALFEVSSDETKDCSSFVCVIFLHLGQQGLEAQDMMVAGVSL